MSQPVEQPGADGSLAAVNAALEQLVPRAHQMGVRFLQLQPGAVRAEVPAEGNGNHFGVVYAGVIFTVAEVLGGAMHFASFDASSHYPLVRHVDIDFLAPGRSRLVASATLPAEEIDRIRATAGTGTKVDFVLHAEVVGDDGTVVARTRGDYQLRPFGR
ncbi:MAG TPA: YiiD C-terminal domain-containing protein [Jatrophihabitans sp.]|nr:YiiD C-terminal domain-containing protein [Jatrophihabitans sp.]